LMNRFPVVIKLGAGLLGYVAGEMLISEPVLEAYEQGQIVQVAIPLVGAFVVLAIGTSVSAKVAARRARAASGEGAP